MKRRTTSVNGPGRLVAAIAGVALRIAPLLLIALSWPALAQQDDGGQAGATGPRAQSMVELPGGGAIWATEDPQLAAPSFAVSAGPAVAFDEGRIVEPVRFLGYGNYLAFAAKVELRIFRGTDDDLASPLATLEMPLRNVSQVEWNGALPAALTLREGDELQYVARVIAPDGSFDETVPRRLQLVRPQEVERLRQRLLDSASGALVGLPVRALEDRQALDRTYGRSDLRLQNITIRGSRVRIQGQGLPPDTTVRINGDPAPIDLEGKFVAEYFLPVGEHRFAVEVGQGSEASAAELVVDVTGRYFFMVALADATLSQNSVSGALVPSGIDDHYDDVLSEGRLAFYLKGKVQGRFLVTAQADTQERALDELFDGFMGPDPRDVFRRLDPDRYYPVYGDDSGVRRDVDTQGRLYLRVDWDGNEALWGNFATGFTGSEYGQYVRSLYGAALHWRSRESTALGEARRSLRAFGSEAQSALGHSEFLGTGGSLYYLRDVDLLPGSETVMLELRDRTTGRVASRRLLSRDADYEVDELQGRLLLKRPLSQLVREGAPGITRDAPLDGLETRLLVDYEYVPAGISGDDVTTGMQGRAWLNEHVAVGGTLVDENRSGDDYRLGGLDLTLRAGRGTYLRLEGANSEATVAPVFFSTDGGLSFVRQNATAVTGRQGDARSAELRANLRELGWTASEWTTGAWWRDVEPGFSVARSDSGLQIRQTGAEFTGELTPDLRLSGRYSDADRGADGIEQGQLLLEWGQREDALLSGEVRRVTETRQGEAAAGTLAAIGYSRRFDGVLDLYGIAQLTLDDDSGAYPRNDLYTLGAKYLFAGLSSFGAELSSGDRGEAASMDVEYRLTADHSLYAGYVYSTDDDAFEPVLGARAPAGLTLGQRWRLSDQVSLYNESQSLRQDQGRALAHTFGMDFFPARSWTTGFTLQQSELEAASGTTERYAASVSGGYTSPDTSWSSRLEYRRDTGATDRRQWVSTNRFNRRLDDDWRVALRLNYSDTDDWQDVLGDARFVEGNVGFSYRPARNDRWNVLGKLTWLSDTGSSGQAGLSGYEQRSRVASLEGIYRLSPRWEGAAKLARRVGEARVAAEHGPWFDSTANFAAVQARFATMYRWEALAEYRWLDSNGGGARRGWLVGIDRRVGSNFRIGVGYNFTSFSDDLTLLDLEHKGWFLNLNGVY